VGSNGLLYLAKMAIILAVLFFELVGCLGACSACRYGLCTCSGHDGDGICEVYDQMVGSEDTK
jgi:hypothetical protein